MSKYEWERGEIKLPAKDYPKVRDAVIAAHNREQDKRYTKALELYEKLTKLLKGKRGIDKHRFLTDDYYREDKGFARSCLDYADSGRDDYERTWAIERSLFPYDAEKREHRRNPLKPKKKDFAKANKSTRSFRADEAVATFDPKAKTVYWSVEENNHAVENASNTWLAGALFGALSYVTWTSRTGGTITGNDEYNREADDEGGGGCYVTREFRKKKQESSRAYGNSTYASAGYARRRTYF